MSILRIALLLFFSAVLGVAQRSVTPLEYGQYYGFPPDLNDTGALVLNPHHIYFMQLPAESIKAVHGHLQHFAPGRPDDEFPYEELQNLEAQQMASGGPPIFVTATYAGKRRPVYFSWHLELDSSAHPTADPKCWSRAVNLRDDGFIRLFADAYCRKHMFQPLLQNYWLAADNCSFWIGSYGVLDDQNVYHPVTQFDPPFAQNDEDFLDSIIYFLKRLKEIAPDIHLMGNEGSMSDESRFAQVWSGFDGTIREDITASFQPDAQSRREVYLAYTRYQWEGPAGKVALLRALIPDDPTFQDKLRTAYAAYLIFRGPNFFFGPRYDSRTNGVPVSAYKQMQVDLGEPAGAASDELVAGDSRSGYRLYSRRTTHGIVYLNWSGKTVAITLPEGGTYVDRNGNGVKTLSIPDLSGDYVLLK
ncbi:MAG: hypothetical protein JO015_09010 [Verrucomicrobia bacterium]|nr:hypothetical protein [Verrucomicrobiota bacterium]